MHRHIALLLVAGCVPLSYAFTPATNAPIKSRPSGCEFKVVTSTPTEGYEEIGELERYNGTPPKDTETFRKAVAEQVCQNGGDGVIATANVHGELTKGMIVRFVSHAEPIKRLTVTPTIQQSDNENPNRK